MPQGQVLPLRLHSHNAKAVKGHQIVVEPERLTVASWAYSHTVTLLDGDVRRVQGAPSGEIGRPGLLGTTTRSSP